MKIYEFNALHNDFASYTADDKYFIDRVFKTNGKPKVKLWPETIKLEFNDDSFNQGKVMPDIGYISPGSVVLSAKAAKTLGKFLRKFGELLPVNYKESIYYFYNVTTFIDCGAFQKIDPLDAMEPPTLLADRVPKEPTIFKIQANKGQILVAGDYLKNQVKENKLTGGLFNVVLEK